MLKKVGFLAILVFLSFSTSLAYFDLGKPTDFVDDYTNTLSVEQKGALESKLARFEAETTNEVFVVIIQNLQGDTIENFANTLFNNWGIGKKDLNNGVLFLISLDERRMRIEVGYGLEPYITDAEAFALIDKIAKPAFREGDYFTGIDVVTDSIFDLVSGREVVLEQEQSLVSIFSWDSIFTIVFVLIIFLGSFLARTKSWWAGGLIGVIIGTIVGFFTDYKLGIVSAIILLPIGLIFDYGVSRADNYQRKYGRSPWWWGGGGFGGGGGGFGGGGGGRSGGGGASGGW